MPWTDRSHFRVTESAYRQFLIRPDQGFTELMPSSRSQNNPIQIQPQASENPGGQGFEVHHILRHESFTIPLVCGNFEIALP